ncbi:CHASE domain-containing protein [Thiomicrorhabdus lithotrophica]|uniref:histidine kinase n=1 Tax=Thiomicrorhabdus lithotrophica TaxID=2949997 RepID=A0ABY8CGF4_9GAMM|nr:ATP-binding protein [Thiomicrorhabdus lithotrophica]WEJ63571.1 PAS domain S-box protein [Thiomicrorhabdus lithotrophica]
MLSKLSIKAIYIISIVVFAMGLQGTSEWIKYNDIKRVELFESQFNKYSSQAYISVKNALNSELERLNSLAAVFKISDSVSQRDFERFAKVLLANDTEVQALEWIELIPKNQRLLFESEMSDLLGVENFKIQAMQKGKLVHSNSVQDYYAVVKYVYPYQKNVKAIGLDAYSQQHKKNAMYIADITQSPITTPPLQLIQQSSSDYSVIIYQPIYDKADKLQGYVTLILDMKKFLEHVKTKSFIESSLGLFFVDSDNNQFPFGLTGSEYLIEEAMYRSHEFFLPFAGRNWLFNAEVNLKFLPDYQVMTHKSIQKSWLYGVLLSLLVSIVVFLTLKYRYQLRVSAQSIEKQQRRYHEIIDQSSEAYYLLNCDGNILDINAATCAQLGYSRIELLQMNISDIDVKYTTNQIKDFCKELQAGTKFLLESIHQRKDGKTIPVEVSATKFKIDGHYVTCSFVRDLTERITYRDISVNNEQLQNEIEKATLELSDQKRAFETIFEKSADGIFISEGRHVLDCNQATVDLFGYKSKEQLLSLPNKVFAPKTQPDGESSHRKGFRMLQICLEKGSHRYEWVNRRANGENFWTDVVLTRLEYFGRTVIHIAFRDISKRKQLEAEMISAREHAIAANKAKSEFLAKMSHDIRTPLHGILSYSQMGETRFASVKPEKLKRYFENIHTSAQRLMLLLNDVLDSAKLESGLMRFDFKLQNLEPIIEACIAEQTPLIQDKNIQVEVKNLDYMACIDSNRLAQVVSNLLNNAIRYTPEGEKIQISVNRIDSKSIQFSIQDCGKGIHPNEFESIFEKFVQSNQESQNTGGTGLGLAISKEIVEAHNGRIWVENWLSNNKVQGAVFRFTLPLEHSNGI